MNNDHYQKVMNDTKWNEIRLAMHEFHNKQQWRTKAIITGYTCSWDSDWYYHFKQVTYKDIEWVEIKTETEEIKKDIIRILKGIHVPGEDTEGLIKVYGYTQIGKTVEYL